MNTTQFANLQAAATALDLKINQLQNSPGVMSDEDQQAINNIETASKQLLQAVADFKKPQQESVAHQEAVTQDKRVRPGETPAEHAARMQANYPVTGTYPAPGTFPGNNPPFNGETNEQRDARLRRESVR